MAFTSGALQRRHIISSSRCSKAAAVPAAVRRALVLTCQASPAPSVSTADAASFVKAGSQLEQLASMTVLSIDSGDLHTIEKFAATGFITDATTNPLFGKQSLAVHAMLSDEQQQQ
jgi:hypothetical protein